MKQIKIDNHSIAITNPDKIWFPKSKIKKGEIINYYHDIASYFLAHTKNHLLMLHRFPNGIKEESFYQKNAPEYFPSWIKTVSVKKSEGGHTKHIICTNAATVLYLVNFGVLTFHSWLSQAKKLDFPDRMIFDLDPSRGNFSDVKKIALAMKEIFDSFKIPSFTMTTGSRGLHIWVPLKRVHTFDQIAQFADFIAEKIVHEHPQHVTVALRKEKRQGKIFIDTLRNREGATAVSPYAVRAYEKAPVAAPLFWQELYSKQLTPQRFTIANIGARLKGDGNPWKDMQKHAVSLKKLFKLMG